MGWKAAMVSVFVLAGVTGGVYAANHPFAINAGGLPGVTKPIRTVGNALAATVQLLVTTDNAPTPTPVVIAGVHMAYNPFAPSDGAYPKLTSKRHVWIDVSISQELVYLFDGNRLLYTMITSSGLDTTSDNSTPLGVYHIQAQRGTWFYSQQYKEGAQYWVSWLGHGIFLFHSVPEDVNERLLADNAARLGHPASHGCFHLTIPDARWVYNDIPRGTTVVVEQAPVKLQGKTIYAPTKDQQAAIVASLAAGANSAASVATNSASTG